jgi:two-component system, OmpR family, phosphate regulon sensor histidine kinase PhoR
MKRPAALLFLMAITILAITSFQVYWMYDNYRREKSSLEIKSGALFREATQTLQALKLRLDRLPGDSSRLELNIRIKQDADNDTSSIDKRKAAIRLTNMLRSRDLDTTMVRRPPPGGMIIAMNRNKIIYTTDSVNLIQKNASLTSEEKGIGLFLRDFDSIQDSLKIEDIDSSFHQILNREKLSLVYTILRIDNPSKAEIREPSLNKVTVGFSKPVMYELLLAANVPYFWKKLWLPLLFSLFLILVTITSFIWLYRNLLLQRRLTKQKNDFISNMSHELKTPIATVGVAIEALKHFNALADPERTREYLDISESELKRLSLLVDKVLKFSLFENHETELHFGPVNLIQLTEEVISSLRLQAEKHNARFEYSFDGLDFTVTADRVHLLGVLYNLADNAIKYSVDEPFVKIALVEEKDQVKLSVTDSGKGIPAEYKDKVFEKFFRVPDGDRHNTKGYGLGLSYAAHIVALHKGKIVLESEEGKGSCFTIYIPKLHE